MANVLLTHLNDGKHKDVAILSEAAVKEMHTPQFGGGSGLDFGIREFDGETFIMHGGGVPGFSTVFILGPKSKVGVYIAANASNVHTPIRILAQSAIDLLRGSKIGTGLVREMVGTGIALEVDKGTGMVRILEVIPRSPASRAGLSPGHMIRQVDGVSLAGKSLKECLRLLGGESGSKVRLQLVNPRSKETTAVELTRERFLVSS
jgi:hypothetical protein